MDAAEAAERARRRDLVRRGYDAISQAYRGDDGSADAPSAEDVRRYAGWVAELASLLRPGARVVDLGCGAGIPATRELAARGLQVLGVDFSAVQLGRARRLVPAARFAQADMAGLELRPASADAVVAFYSLIHLPLPDQRALFPRIRGWLRPGGYLLAIVGAGRWQAPSHSWVPRCSGTTPIPPATWTGCGPRGWNPGGTVTSRRGPAATPWSWPKRPDQAGPPVPRAFA